MDTEIYIVKSRTPTAQSITYSIMNFKSLVGITPTGAFSFGAAMCPTGTLQPIVAS